MELRQGKSLANNHKFGYDHQHDIKGVALMFRMFRRNRPTPTETRQDLKRPSKKDEELEHAKAMMRAEQMQKDDLRGELTRTFKK
jgi:hypothetical protein